MTHTVLSVVSTESKKTTTGKEFNVLTLSNGCRIKAYKADWPDMPKAIDSSVHRLYQPASFEGSDGKTINQLPVLRRLSNATALSALGFTVNRPSKPE